MYIYVYIYICIHIFYGLYTPWNLWLTLKNARTSESSDAAKAPFVEVAWDLGVQPSMTHGGLSQPSIKEPQWKASEIRWNPLGSPVKTDKKAITLRNPGWNFSENRWKWMKMDENGWKWMKMDENEWKQMKMDVSKSWIQVITYHWCQNRDTILSVKNGTMTTNLESVWLLDEFQTKRSWIRWFISS